MSRQFSMVMNPCNRMPLMLQRIESSWVNYQGDSIANIKKTIEQEKAAQWSAEGESVLFNAKRENIGLQLEAAYRERLAQVHSEVRGVAFLINSVSILSISD